MSDFLLCLSSGMTPQYRLDILRLLALPRNSHIQFRYGREIVAEKLREALDGNLRSNEKAILAHVDCNESARTLSGFCPITPCRHAILLESERLGEFYFLRFRLEEFARWEILEKFQEQVHGDVPHWDRKNELDGHWCLEQSFEIGGKHKVADLTGWQHVIKDLARSRDFAEEPFFFAVEGIRARQKKTTIQPINGEVCLKSERDYVAQLFHFQPDEDAHPMRSVVGSIKVEVSTPYLESATSSMFPVSSPYDMRDFYFRANQTVGTRFGSIVLKVVDNAGEAILTQPEVFVPVRVKPTWGKTVGLVLLIAVFLFAQQYISAAVKGPLPTSTTVLLALLAVGTSLVAVLGLKKPV
jgi:hypothetical protein